MSRRSRTKIRRLPKWAGAFVCAALLLVWMANAFQDMRWFFGQWILDLERGDLWLSSGDPLITSRRGWEATSIREIPEFRLGSLPRVHTGNPGAGEVRYVFCIPLWLPFILVAAPTAYLFWRQRRIPPGYCQNCGYNLTGNTSGICLECGGPVPDGAIRPKNSPEEPENAA